MPDSMPPALVVERFDIRERPDRHEDAGARRPLLRSRSATDAKYERTMERVARAVRPLSTAPDEDLLIIVKRALFAWLIADGDMHLKNMALLKIGGARRHQFRTVRMAPLYDALTTRVFPISSTTAWR